MCGGIGIKKCYKKKERMKIMEANKGTWGGVRAGAGRKLTAPEGIPRKQHQLRASDSEWEKIRLFASIVKKSPELADKMLAMAK